MSLDVDYIPGDPAHHILGRPEEKPARRHRDLPPKPPVVTAATIRYSIELRLDEQRAVLARAQAEIETLQAVLSALREDGA